MVVRPNDNEIAALLQVGGSENGRVILEWLKRSEDLLTSALISEEIDTGVRRLQGGVKVIKDITHYLNKAREIQSKRK